MLVVGLFAWASLQGCGTQSEGRCSSMLYFRFRETQGMLYPNHRKVINGRNTTEAESLSPSDQLQFCTPGLGVPSCETHVHPEVGLTGCQLYHLPTVPLLNPDLASKGHIILGRSHWSLLSMGSCSLSILLLWRPTPGREDSSPKAKL